MSVRYRQSPIGGLRRASTPMVERSGRFHGATAVVWTLVERRRAFQVGVWQKHPDSRLSKQALGLFVGEAGEERNGELKFWKVSCRPLVGVAHCLSCPGGPLQEDIDLRELEDEHWLCDAGTDRHVRQVSERGLRQVKRCNT